MELRGDVVSVKRAAVTETDKRYVEAVDALADLDVGETLPHSVATDDAAGEFSDWGFLQYQREMLGYPLLTAADERRLGFLVELANYAQECKGASVSGLLIEVFELGALLSAVLGVMGWPRRLALSTATSNPALLERAGGPLDVRVARHMGREFGWTEAQTEDALVRLSHALGLLPPNLETLVGYDPRVDELPRAAKTLKGSHAAAASLARHMANVLLYGTVARNRLVEHNLRLGAHLARRRMRQGLPLLDLIQEANIGLIKAADKFEQRRGFKFSTYATWWIRQSISRAVMDQGSTIRLPVHMGEKLLRLYPVIDDLRAADGTDPSVDEIVDEYERRYDDRMPADTLVAAMQAREVESLEQLLAVDEDGDGYPDLHDEMIDRSAVDPNDAAVRQLLSEQIEATLDSLTGRERRVLQLRFGLDGGPPRTLEQIGREFNVTRERIRQIEAKAFRKLKHPSRSRRLKAYFDGPHEPTKAMPPSASLTGPSTLTAPDNVSVKDARTTAITELRKGDWVSLSGRIGRIAETGDGFALASTSGWSLRRDRDRTVQLCHCDAPNLDGEHAFMILGQRSKEFSAVPKSGKVCANCLRPAVD